MMFHKDFILGYACDEYTASWAAFLFLFFIFFPPQRTIHLVVLCIIAWLGSALFFVLKIRLSLSFPWVLPAVLPAQMIHPEVCLPLLFCFCRCAVGHLMVPFINLYSFFWCKDLIAFRLEPRDKRLEPVASLLPRYLIVGLCFSNASRKWVCVWKSDSSTWNWALKNDYTQTRTCLQQYRHSSLQPSGLPARKATSAPTWENVWRQKAGFIAASQMSPSKMSMFSPAARGYYFQIILGFCLRARSYVHRPCICQR